MNWQEHLRTQGFAHFPGLTPEPLIRAALEAIEMDLNSNYDAERQVEYDNRSYCPDLKGTPPIMNLLLQSPVHDLLDEIFEADKLGWDGGQIAIRRAHNVPEPIPPTPHLDGFASGANGLDEGKIYNHGAGRRVSHTGSQRVRRELYCLARLTQRLRKILS